MAQYFGGGSLITQRPTTKTSPILFNWRQAASRATAPTYVGGRGGTFAYQTQPKPALNLNTGTPVPTGIVQPYTAPTTGTATAEGGTAFPELEVDLEGIWTLAGQYADNEINPQIEEINRQLIAAGYSAEEAQLAIDQAYPVARRSLQKSIYENMVAGEGSLAAMGTGRGGGRQELLARAGEREATGLEGIETQKMRETGAIQRALGQYRGELGSRKIGLEGQRGNLRATYAEQIRGNRFNEGVTRYGIDLNRAQLEESSRQFNTGLGGATGTPQSDSNYFLTDADLSALGLNKKPKVLGPAGAVSSYPYYRPR